TIGIIALRGGGRYRLAQTLELGLSQAGPFMPLTRLIEGGLRVGEEGCPFEFEAVHARAQSPGGTACLVTRHGELVKPEDSLEYGGAIGSRRLQQHREPALWQYYRPQERIRVQSGQAFDLGRDRPGVIEADGRVVQALQLVAALPAGLGGGTE